MDSMYLTLWGNLVHVGNFHDKLLRYFVVSRENKYPIAYIKCTNVNFQSLEGLGISRLLAGGAKILSTLL